jgi:hypothetical protein
VSDWLPDLRNDQCVCRASLSISHMPLNAEKCSVLYTVAVEHFMSKRIFLRIFSRLVP